MSRRKVIVIGGGVGPLAGVKLHEHIIENTLTDGTDQDHFDVYHLSRSGDIPDRTEALLSGTPQVPAEGMLRTFEIADAALNAAGLSGVGGIPCNTFHAPAIFSLFLNAVKKENLSITVVNMIEETASAISSFFPAAKRIGLLSTTGTRKAGVYRDILEPIGFSLIQVEEKNQHKIHESIYNTEWGIKALSGTSPKSRKILEDSIEELAEKGAQAVILGCTEIPIALPEKELSGIPLIDPMQILARALIREADQDKLKPYQD